MQNPLCFQNNSAQIWKALSFFQSLSQEKKSYYHQYLLNIAPNMKVESSATPLLTGYKASSLPGQVCPFHPLSTLELEEKANGFGYVPCPEKMCFRFPLLQNGKRT